MLKSYPPEMMVLESGKGGALKNGISTLRKEDPESSLALSATGGHSETSTTQKPVLT